MNAPAAAVPPPRDPHAFIFTPEVRRVIRELYAPSASDTEFAAMCAIAEARGLDPRLGHCYFSQRFDRNRYQWRWHVLISIDGMRMYAERSGDYGGQDEPEWIYNDAAGPDLFAARVRVYRKSIDRAFVGVAHWDEYVQRDDNGNVADFWARMPRNMLAKCAEAIAMRKAFPQLAQLYTPEEMMQADNDNAKSTPSAPAIPLVLQRLIDDLDQFDGPTLEQLVTVWLDHKQAINAEAGGEDAIVRTAIAEIMKRSPSPISKNEFFAHVRAREACIAHPAMDTFAKALDTATMPATVAFTWRLHRRALGALVDRDRICRDIAWEMACRRVASLDTELRHPKKWLKEEVARADADAAERAKSTAGAR